MHVQTRLIYIFNVYVRVITCISHILCFSISPGGSSSDLTPLSYPGAGIQAMFGIGDRFSMFLSDTPVDGYMLDIIQENSRRFTSIELPDCR